MRHRVSVGWVSVSYLMIAGGVMLAAALDGLLSVTGGWLGHAVYFIGAFVGGFFAGRASPRKTIVEPGIAGVLLVLTMMGPLVLVPDALELARTGDGILKTTLKMGFVTGLGGFVGGLVGEQTSRRMRAPSAVRWWGIATLINLGVVWVLVAVYLALPPATGLLDDDPAGIVLLGLALAAFGTGFVAQAIAPRPMVWACGAGAFGFFVMIVGVTAATGRLDGSGMIGGAVLGGLGVLIGRVGAVLGWRVVGSRRAPAPASRTFPEARVR